MQLLLELGDLRLHSGVFLRNVLFDKLFPMGNSAEFAQPFIGSGESVGHRSFDFGHAEFLLQRRRHIRRERIAEPYGCRRFGQLLQIGDGSHVHHIIDS
ncbi:hypothetical protein D3C76_1690650 [compost metagenome]